MARIKKYDKDHDIDWRGLADEEYDDDRDFDDYDGPKPPRNTILRGRMEKVWDTESEAGNPMFKVLFIADGNDGDKKQYDGCPLWDNVNWTLPQVKFKWQPWLDAAGISLKDIKTKTRLGDDEESMGDPVVSIGSVKFPIDCRVKVDVERKGEYKGTARVGKWLPELDSDADGDGFDDEEDEDEKPF